MEHANAANIKMLHEYEVLCSRLEECSVSFLIEEENKQLNALSRDFLTEFPKALSSLDQNPNVAVIILASSGKHFCSGIDFQTLSDGLQETDCCRKVERLRRHIKFLQEAITAIECCHKSVIAAVHGACIAGAIDIITACDIRFYCSDAFFSVKEVDLAITADLGTLQRLPSIIGFGNAMELALTDRRFTGSEAKELGLVSKVFTLLLNKGWRKVSNLLLRGLPEIVVLPTKVEVRSTYTISFPDPTLWDFTGHVVVVVLFVLHALKDLDGCWFKAIGQKVLLF
ncbi:hypothetical protein RND71_003444 [Anisodus tanguticus]|uniref:Uncharacterized protein n=1 Tax=Anisodus tanguticus TaxID=243964 RepID=A0AAE1SWT0_9SOLA|nr:hypothetical protein RND71_003444 [Anisodus tanguticus]